MVDIKEKLAKARSQVLVNHGFWGNLLLSFKLVETRRLPFKTMGVTPDTLFYDPDFVKECTLSQLKGALIHECMHPAMLHFSRMGSRDKDKWNQAADYAINQYIKKMSDCELPEGALYAEKYEGKAAEEIYNLLPKNQSYGCPQCGQQSFSPSQASGNGDGDGEGKDSQNSGSCPKCGGKGVGFRDYHGEMTPQDEAKIVRKMVGIYDSLSESEKNQGDIPTDVVRAIEEMKNPKVPWEKYLISTVTTLFKRDDYSSSHLSNQYRSIFPKGVFPKLVGLETADLVICVDTSGSMSSDDFKEVAPEVDKLCKMAGRAFVMSCDAEVHECIETNSFTDIVRKFQFMGGGGTSFIPPFEMIKAKGINPQAFIYFTDGYGSFPNRPNYPVIWCATKGAIEKGGFPFGIVIEMGDFHK